MIVLRKNSGFGAPSGVSAGEAASGGWTMGAVLDYLKQEAFVGEDLYVFQEKMPARRRTGRGRIILLWENMLQG